MCTFTASFEFIADELGFQRMFYLKKFIGVCLLLYRQFFEIIDSKR